MILIWGCDRHTFKGNDVGSTKYEGMPGPSGVPSFFVMAPIIGVFNFAMSSASPISRKEGMINAKFRVWRSTNYQSSALARARDYEGARM